MGLQIVWLRALLTSPRMSPRGSAPATGDTIRAAHDSAVAAIAALGNSWRAKFFVQVRAVCRASVALPTWWETSMISDLLSQRGADGRQLEITLCACLEQRLRSRL